jgi:hypothetical protein
MVCYAHLACHDNMERRRPLVVLAGWLGCQPKSLRRYRQLYQPQQKEASAGQGIIVEDRFDVLLCIAPPSAVVQYVFTSSTTTVRSEPCIPPNRWPAHQQKQQQEQQQEVLEDNEHHNVLSAPNMEALAWQVLAHIDQSNCSACIFHVFSNGGCFVWERVRAILDTAINTGSARLDDIPPKSATTTNNNITSSITSSNTGGTGLPSTSLSILPPERLVSIRKRLRGVIFDSCPGTDLYRINEALQYCTWKERLDVILQTKSIQHLLLQYDAKLREIVNRREADYRQRLYNDPWPDVRQLYLYAENDALIDYPSLNALVEHRQSLLGKSVIWKRTWKESQHCAHLLLHPDEYKATIHSFVEACLIPAHAGQEKGDDGSSHRARASKL